MHALATLLSDFVPLIVEYRNSITEQNGNVISANDRPGIAKGPPEGAAHTTFVVRHSPVIGGERC
jgi:hypothetical protein